MTNPKLALSKTHPELANEAYGWDPSQVSSGSNKKLEWKCKKNHIWIATVVNRSNGRGCPVCFNKKVQIGENDLATTHPEIAKEAFDWDPKTVIAGTAKKLQWKCSYGHQWIATGHDRTSNKGCPSCAKTGFDPNKKGYIYFLINSKWEIYQVGITNSPRNRLGRHKRNVFDVLELRGPIDGYSESRTIDSFKVNNLKELINTATEAGF